MKQHYMEQTTILKRQQGYLNRFKACHRNCVHIIWHHLWSISQETWLFDLYIL